MCLMYVTDRRTLDESQIIYAAHIAVHHMYTSSKAKFLRYYLGVFALVKYSDEICVVMKILSLGHNVGENRLFPG